VKCIQGSRPAEAFAPIDGKKLAQELKAEMDYVSPTPQTARRHWVMDQMRAFKAGETEDFYDVKATWVVAMSPESMKAYLKGPYEPLQIHWATR